MYYSHRRSKTASLQKCDRRKLYILDIFLTLTYGIFSSRLFRVICVRPRGSGTWHLWLVPSVLCYYNKEWRAQLSLQNGQSILSYNYDTHFYIVNPVSVISQGQKQSKPELHKEHAFISQPALPGSSAQLWAKNSDEPKATVSAPETFEMKTRKLFHHLSSLLTMKSFPAPECYVSSQLLPCYVSFLFRASL